MFVVSPAAAVICVTIAAATLALCGVLLAPGRDKGLMRIVAVSAVVSMYLMWLVVYLAQINPLGYPIGVKEPEQ